MITVIVERVVHDSGIRVALRFPYEKKIIKIVRTFPDAIWDKNLNCWHIAQSRGIDGKIVKALIEVARIEFKSGRNKKVIEKVREKAEIAAPEQESMGHSSHLPGKGHSVEDEKDHKLSRDEFADDNAIRRQDLADRIRGVRNETERRRITGSRSGLQSFPGESEQAPEGNKEGVSRSEEKPPDKILTASPEETMETGFTSPNRIQKAIPEKPPEVMRVTYSDQEQVTSSGTLSRLSQQAEYDLTRYRDWLESHRYPPNTVRTYTTMMEAFLNFVSPKEASDCDASDLVRMVNECILPRGLSYSYQNQLISAVKKFYREICREKIDPGTFTRPRTRHKLPNVLSKEEVKKILSAPLYEKHRLLLSIIYGCGLRRSEVIMLEPGDIDRDRMLLTVRQSKGFQGSGGASLGKAG